ncbi:MAG: preprotein translocase subunit SecA, partial [Acidimicrobiia bacterium]
MSVFQKILHIGEGKQLKELEGLVEQVNAFEPAIEALSDDELGAKTPEFRQRLSAGETLDDIQAEAFAVVREAAKRVLGQRHFDVQVVGAGALHLGMIAEMRTGEGKTLVSTMPCYLNALDGGGVHVVTVNDYLAKRDSEWMGDIYRFLGLEVGLIQAHMEPHERKPSYDADITYGTNNEFGFDYLRDNMAMRPEDMVQRGHAFAVVDEVDSILVDEARTPLIISGRVADTAKWYRDFARIADRLQRDLHYEVDEAKRQVLTTEEGVARVEETLGIENMYDYSNVDLVHHLESSLRAKELFEKDVEYLVTDGEVKIVDEFTGRVLDGRRYSEGLHQAIEAKEGVAIKDENQTLATITLQNYFRMYEKLSGMTGTALTEEAEFNQIYGLSVVEIPTNAPIVRADEPDLVYMTEKAKFEAVADDLAERHKKGQPVLVGTVSIEKSERLAALLKRRNIPHQVLNAKQHEREAHIIAQAGGVGVVTVATNMAGRGVDIRLGGNPEELALAAMARFPELEAGSDEYEAEHRKQL